MDTLEAEHFSLNLSACLSLSHLVSLWARVNCIVIQCPRLMCCCRKGRSTCAHCLLCWEHREQVETFFSPSTLGIDTIAILQVFQQIRDKRRQAPHITSMGSCELKIK